jgi:hypothetical protein
MIDYFARVVQEDLNVGIDPTTRRNPAGGTLAATQVGIHTVAVGQLAIYKTWDPGDIAVSTTATETVAYPGAALGDFVLVSFSLSLTGMSISGYVSVANTVTAVITNNTSTAINLASGTLSVLVFKARSAAEDTGGGGGNPI